MILRACSGRSAFEASRRTNPSMTCCMAGEGEELRLWLFKEVLIPSLRVMEEVSVDLRYRIAFASEIGEKSICLIRNVSNMEG